MIHVTEGTIQALLDGELPPAERGPVERHLEECSTCRAEADLLRALSGTFSAVLPVLDGRAGLGQALHEVQRRRWRARWRGEALRALPRAAVLVLAVATVASATLPGSPVREWVEGLWKGGAVAAPAEGPASGAPSGSGSAPAEASAPAAVSILPEEGNIRVVLKSAARGVRIRVRLSAEPFSDVRATGAAALARFRTSPGRIEISGATGGEVEVVLPRSARSAVVEVDGRPYLRKDGDGLRLLAPASDSTASEVVFTVEP